MKKVLLDENLDRRLKTHFSDNFEVVAVPDLGWQSKKNGELLVSMDAEGFTHLVTADRNLQFQQNLQKFSVTVVLIRSFDVRLNKLKPLIPQIEAAILAADPTEKVIEVELRHE